MNEMEEGLIRLVAKLAEKYTSKESTSITYSRAEKLMGAVIYTLQEAEGFGIEEESALVFAPHFPDLEATYQKGYQRILMKTKATQEFYNGIIRDFFAYGNLCYEETVVKGIPAFFLHYDIRFEPQNHILTLDYPVLSKQHTERGIDLIEKYLRSIWMEQLFLEYFERTEVLQLLLDYHPECSELIINVCEIVLRNAIGCLLANHSPLHLRVESKAYPLIEEKVLKMHPGELEEEIIRLLRILMQKYFHNNQELFQYLVLDAHDFSVSLHNAVEHHCLRSIFQ